ncbi:hypothetical protein [Flavobacterium sp.]|jgi:hypothetical protein|uniref:hypothetical protein n=1 Tax=Flavobacterium sp. TaxID=239 RepID=UPI0037BE4EBB
MKTKKDGKFTLEKFEVAKLKPATMKKIVGGLGDNDPIGGTDRKGPKDQGGNV